MIHRRKREEETDHWKSYSDMMAALLLMFILIMSTMLIVSNKQNIELQEQKEQINRILGVKPELIKDLKKELTGFGVRIDENTGDIQFESDILFDYNKFNLKSAGTNFLSDFMPKYLKVILSEKYMPYIAEIIIEGHTDNVGGYLDNLELSQSRALSVAQFIVGENSKFVSGDAKDQLRKILTVTGKSFTVPIYTDGEIDANRSRRVELKFRLKDDETIKELEKILK